MNRLGNWSLAANVAELDLNDDDCNDERSVPGIYNAPTKNREKRSSLIHVKMFGGDEVDEHTNLYTKSRGVEKRSSMPSLFPNKNLLTTVQKNPTPTKKDPLMAYLENRSKAHDEYKRRQDEAKRQQELQDLDDDKSVASSSSFFDFFSRPGALDYSDEEEEEVISEAGKSFQRKVKKSGSVASLFNFFQDAQDEEVEEKRSMSTTVPTKESVLDVPTKPIEGKKESTSFETAINQCESVSGSKIFRRGKRAANRGDWKKAVSYYHIALVKQREYYGENHGKTAETLNELGVALMHMKEYFGAMTALEESLHIRQKLFGDGAEEVALTTNNIWLVLKASQEEQSGDGS